MISEELLDRSGRVVEHDAHDRGITNTFICLEEPLELGMLDPALHAPRREEVHDDPPAGQATGKQRQPTRGAE